MVLPAEDKGGVDGKQELSRNAVSSMTVGFLVESVGEPLGVMTAGPLLYSVGGWAHEEDEPGLE